MRRACLWILLVGVVGCQLDEQPGPPVLADTLYTNARVYTVDPDNPWADGLAVEGSRLLAVGSEAELLALEGPDTRRIDLGGRFVMPGIHDTHIHPMEGGLQKRIECSFLSNQLPEVLDVLRECIAGTPTGEWVRGGQWNDALLAGDRLPKAILDEIAPDHPVFLMDWSVHNAWVNSEALRRFGIDRNTADPAGGVIVRDATSGEATGILLDNAAYDFRRQLPGYTLDQRAEAMSWSIDHIGSFGVTTFKGALVTTAAMEAYRALETRHGLPLRVKTSLSWKSAWANSHADERRLIEGRKSFVSNRISPDFAKIMLDGIPPTYTAALLEPYAPGEAHGSEHRGKLMISPEQLAEDLTVLDREGLTVKMHATGDRSARAALDAVEAARKANGDSGLIHEVSHAALLHPDDVPRFKALNVAAEMCPILWYPIPGLDWERWLGPERSKIWPVKTLTESGALVIYGSDWPVVPTPNPWLGIESMVTRSDPSGLGTGPDWPEQAVDLATAVRIFTANGAIANRVGDSSGSLETGRDADFIVLDRDIFEVPISEVGETRVLMSVVGGEALFDQR